MKTLLRVNYKVWFSIFIVMLLSAVALTLIFRMKIEKTFTTKLMVDDQDTSTLIVKDKGAYLINEGDNITLMVNSEFISTKIVNIKFDGKEKEYKIELKDIKKSLLPNTSIDAQIIYDSHTVFDALVNPGV